jgi:hypothetical protein
MLYKHSLRYFYIMKNLLIAFLFLETLISCGNEEKKETKTYISLLSLIKAQVAHIDTSLYPIVKIVSYDSMHQDTTYIPREEFAKEARDFLDIPDLADKKVAQRYKEDPPLYDETIGRVMIRYTPIDPDKEEIKSQELLATPMPGMDAKINNLIIIRQINNRDSFLQKKMLWKIDKSFQIVTTSQKPGQPEVTTVTSVVWNEDPYQ